MQYKRLTLICGHYGTGKTNIAVNMALDLKRSWDNTAIADLDIVNPYFRTKDSEDDLARAGIKLICSEYANSNLDIPALPQEIYTITDDRSMKVILDIGGDDRGAYVLGRIAPAIKEENDYEMLMVVNAYRPLTRDAASTQEVMREIERACGIPFTGIVNNSNLGAETTPEDVLKTVRYADDISDITGLPVVVTCAQRRVAAGLEGKIRDLFPLDLQKKIL